MNPTSKVENQKSEWWYETGPDTVALGMKMRLVHREETPFQTLEVYEHDLLGRVLALDGILQTTEKDEFVYHEMLTHVPLLGSRALDGGEASVLVIGGGDGGTLREVLTYDAVARAVMVEIDEAVVRVSRKHLHFGPDYDDARVELRFEDAARYVASEAAQAHPFDAILVDSTDPIGPGEALFTPEFLRDARACLKPQGVFARHLCMPAYQLDVLEAGVRRLDDVFARVEVYRATIPTYLGADMAFVACTRDGASVRAPHRERTGRYYNAAVHRAAFALPTWWLDGAGETGNR